MTHPNEDATLTGDLMELVSQEGLAGMPKAIAILLNEAMKIQRAQALNASPYSFGTAIPPLGYEVGVKM